MCTYQYAFKAPLLVTSTGCVFSEWEQRMFSAQSWEPCKSTITGDISPAWWAEGRPLGSLALSGSLSLSLSLTQILFPLHSREKNWHSSCPTLGGFKGAVIQQMKCRESSAESRGTNPITIHLSETVNCTGWDKILSELWLTKLNEPLTSNIWLCQHYLTTAQDKNYFWPLELFIRSHQLR